MSEVLAKFDWNYNRIWEDETRYQTLVSQFESGREQRRGKGKLPRIFRLEFEKQTITKEDAHEIYEFFKARQGRLEPFHWDYIHSDGSVEEVKVRFDMDNLSREVFLNHIYRFGLTFKEVF